MGKLQKLILDEVQTQGYCVLRNIQGYAQPSRSRAARTLEARELVKRYYSRNGWCVVLKLGSLVVAETFLGDDLLIVTLERAKELRETGCWPFDVIPWNEELWGPDPAGEA